MLILHNILQNANDILTLVTLALSVLTWIATRLHFRSKWANTILSACLTAEKAIDAAAYNDQGQLNEARLNLAMSLVKLAAPRADTALIKTEIEAYLASIHQIVATLPPEQKALTTPPK